MSDNTNDKSNIDVSDMDKAYLLMPTDTMDPRTAPLVSGIIATQKAPVLNAPVKESESTYYLKCSFSPNLNVAERFFMFSCFLGAATDMAKKFINPPPISNINYAKNNLDNPKIFG